MVINNILNFLISSLPIIFWLFFFFKQDIHPEPKKYLFFAFFLGIFIVGPIFIFQFLLNSTSNFDDENLLYIVSLAFIEELFKFIVVFLLISKKPIFDEPIDAVIYLSTTALGLALIENIFIVLNKTNILDVSQIISLRFLGANLLHALSSGFLGYQWAIGILKNKKTKYIALGLIYATLIHALYNFIILKFPNYQNIIYNISILLMGLLLLIYDLDSLKRRSN